jgi:hypothetical protein
MNHWDSDLLESLGYTHESAERLWRQYIQARGAGESADKIHKDGWCGDLIDLFADRYYADEQAHKREMALFLADGGCLKWGRA